MCLISDFRCVASNLEETQLKASVNFKKKSVISSQFYSYSQLSQMTNVPEGALQSVQHTASSIYRLAILDPFNREKMEETSGIDTDEGMRGPCSLDRHAIDVVDQSNTIKLQHRQSDGLKGYN